MLKSNILAATFAGICISAASPANAGTDPLVVRTGSGPVAGITDENVFVWKGIPYAAPPVGDLRWRAPQPVQRWTGIKAARQYRNDCMQKPFGGDAAPLGETPAEDCLYLNIWKPRRQGGKLPVVLWIYGGGFVNGGSSPATYSGARLAEKGVLFVSFNYRVGRFGTFAHPALTRANEDHGLLGNYGFLDQIAALKWVRRNIAAFGGDPRNITVIGESAGGASVHNLLTSPMTQGMVQRAVIMSGGDGKAMLDSTLAAAERVGIAFGQSKGISPTDPGARAKLRALSAEQVTDGLNLAQLFRKDKRTFSSPFPDGRIAVQPRSAYEAGRFNHVPVMIGATSMDIGGNDGEMISGAREVAGLLAGKGAPTFYYRFSYVAESQRLPGAPHASDIPFFLDTQALKYGAKTTRRDNSMGAVISSYVVNFAKSGNPNGAGLPHWTVHSPSSETLMLFGPQGDASQQPDPGRNTGISKPPTGSTTR